MAVGATSTSLAEVHLVVRVLGRCQEIEGPPRAACRCPGRDDLMRTPCGNGGPPNMLQPLGHGSVRTIDVGPRIADRERLGGAQDDKCMSWKVDFVDWPAVIGK